MMFIFLIHFLWASPATTQSEVCIHCSSQNLSKNRSVDSLQQVVQGSILNSNCSTQTQQRALNAIIKGRECLQKIGSAYVKDADALFKKKVNISCFKKEAELATANFATAYPSCSSNKQAEIKINERAGDSEESHQDTLFHEFLHLMGPEGHPHVISVDMTEACPKCCFHPDKDKSTEAACRICRGEFKYITPEYLLALFESNVSRDNSSKSKTLVTSAAYSALYTAADKKPYLRILPRIISGQNGFFRIAESLHKVLKNRKIYGEILEPLPHPKAFDASVDQLFGPADREVADRLSEALVSLLEGNPKKAKEALKIKIDPGTHMSADTHQVNLYSFQRALASFLAKYERENPPSFARVKSILGFDAQSWIDKHPTIEGYMSNQSIDVYEKVGWCSYLQR